MDAKRKDGLMDTLTVLGERRRGAREALREAEVQAGAVAAELLEYGVPKAEVARPLKISPPHVTKIIELAREAGRLGRAAGEAVPTLGIEEALAAVREGGGAEAVTAAFEEFEVLLWSGLPPEAFLGRYGLEVPNILIRTASGRRFGVENVNVGYGGTGPRNAEDFLLAAGFGRQIADLALGKRFFCRDLADPKNDGEAKDGLFGVRAHEIVAGAVVARLEQEDLPGTYEAARRRTGPEAAWGGARSPFEAWLRVLDWEGRPGWMRGERVARVFMDFENATRQGFVSESGIAGRGATFQVVLEQGDMQLWLETYEPLAPFETLSEEAYGFLGRAGLYPRGIEGGPAARFFEYVRRAFRGLRGQGWVDISESGEARLRHVPVPPGSPEGRP